MTGSGSTYLPSPGTPLGVPHFVHNANRESGGNVESVEPYLVADTFTVRVCWLGHPKAPENTHGPYRSHKGQCAICWRWSRRRADMKWRDTMTSYRALRYRWTRDRWRRRKQRERLEQQLMELEATREAFIASLDGPEADAARAAFAAVGPPGGRIIIWSQPEAP
jgi:hypothetical protein